MNTVPQSKSNVPQPNAGSQGAKAGRPAPRNTDPYAAEVYLDFERDKAFLTLSYRNKQAGPRDAQWALVTAVLDALTAAGVTLDPKGLEIALTPLLDPSGQAQTAETPYRIHIKAPLWLDALTEREIKAITAALRVRFGGAAKKGSGQ